LKKPKIMNRFILIFLIAIAMVSGMLLLQKYFQITGGDGSSSTGKAAYADSVSEFSKLSKSKNLGFDSGAADNSDSENTNSPSDMVTGSGTVSVNGQDSVVDGDSQGAPELSASASFSGSGADARVADASAMTMEEIVQTREILQQEAQRQNIVVSDELVDSTIQASLQMYGMTEQELQAELTERGMSMESYKSEMKTNLEIAKLITDNVDLDSIEVTVGEVDAFIAANQEAFSDFLDNPDAMEMIRVRVRNLLIQQKQQEIIEGYVETISAT